MQTHTFFVKLQYRSVCNLNKDTQKGEVCLIKNKVLPILQKVFSSLKHKEFRYFWFGQCISLIGTWMQRTAQIWLVYTMTNSPFMVGMVGVCQFTPILLFTLFAGAVVDRFPKRNILLMTQSALMIQAIVLALLAYFGILQYWHILLLSIFLGLTQTFDMPARQSFFIELVGRADIMNAVSLNSTIVNLAKIIGPALSGLVMVNFGAVYCFSINAISFFAVLLSLFYIDALPQQVIRKKQKVIQEVKEGLCYIKQSKALMINIMFMAIICTFVMNNDVIIPVFAKSVLGLGAAAYTGLMSAAGIGAFIGAVFMAFRAEKGVGKRFFLFCLTATAFLQVFMIFVADYNAAFLCIACIGFLNLAFMNMGNSIFQLHADGEYRGRVMSVYSFLNQGSTPVGNFYAGTAMEYMGGLWGFPLCGIAALGLLGIVFICERHEIFTWIHENEKRSDENFPV
jgi:MFS family permease